MPVPGSLLYLGCAGGPEQALAERAGIPFRAIWAGGVRSLRPWRAAWNLMKLAAGAVQAFFVLRAFRADAVLLTGGYVSVPVALAARWLRKPILIYLPDIVPGLAIRRLSRWVSRVAVSFDESLAYFPAGKAVVTGYPVRDEFMRADRAEARATLGLRDDLPVVTIFGGSRGAHSINTAALQGLTELLRRAQVVHVTGREDATAAEQRRNALPDDTRDRYHPFAYLHDEMIAALAAADLVVARAGASTLGELPALGLPAVLVPYPYSGQHQEANADYLVARGAAIKLKDAELEQSLVATVSGLLDDRERLADMARASRSLARLDAARRIASELRSLAAAA